MSLHETYAGARAAGDPDRLIAALSDTWGVSVHDAVGRYVSATLDVDHVDGPLRIRGIGAALHPPRSFSAVLGVLGDAPFPALEIGGHAGVPFWLLLESGRVISLHHDASLFELAAGCAGFGTAAFLDRFTEQGSAMDIDQLLALQAGLAARGADEERHRAEVACAALGLSMRQLARACGTLPLEFLHLEPALVEEWAAELAEARAPSRGPALPPQLLAALATPQAVRSLDLRGLVRQKKLPRQVLELTDLEELDLSDNPGLDLGHAFEQLASLPRLRSVRFDRCRLKTLPESLASLDNLERLTLRCSALKGPDNHLVLDDVAPLVARLSRLTALEIWYSAWRGGDLSALAGLSNLQRLVLHPLGMHRLDGAISEILSGTRSLVDLEVRGLRDAPAAVAELPLRRLALPELVHRAHAPDVEPLRNHATLRVLDTRSESMSALPDVVRTLPGLEVWHATVGHKARVAALPDWIGELTALRELTAHRLTERPPDSLGELTSLETLDLSEGTFAELPDLGRSTRLRVLRLGGGRRADWALPETVRRLEGLEELTFDGPPPSWLPELARLRRVGGAGSAALCLPEVREIELRAIPEDLPAHRHLQRVRLVGFAIDTDPDEALAAVAALPDLRALTLVCLRVERLPAALAERPLESFEASVYARTEPPHLDLSSALRVLACTPLRRLALHWDVPMRLPDEIALLTGLEELVLKGSGVSGLNDALCQLGELRHLHLDRTKVGAAERRRLEKRLPGCRFTVTTW